MVVISQKHQLLARIASCLRLDKKDKSNLHVEIDAIMVYLADYGIPVAPRQYETLATEMLNNEVVGKVKLGEPGMLEYIANMLLTLAVNMLQAAELSAHESHNDEPPELMTDGEA